MLGECHPTQKGDGSLNTSCSKSQRLQRLEHPGRREDIRGRRSPRSGARDELGGFHREEEMPPPAPEISRVYVTRVSRHKTCSRGSEHHVGWLLLWRAEHKPSDTQMELRPTEIRKVEKLCLYILYVSYL